VVVTAMVVVVVEEEEEAAPAQLALQSRGARIRRALPFEDPLDISSANGIVAP
jgi:hypothetical protein